MVFVFCQNHRGKTENALQYTMNRFPVIKKVHFNVHLGTFRLLFFTFVCEYCINWALVIGKLLSIVIGCVLGTVGSSYLRLCSPALALLELLNRLSILYYKDVYNKIYGLKPWYYIISTTVLVNNRMKSAHVRTIIKLL